MARQATDSLAEYRRKRDFAKTAEPSGAKKAKPAGKSFVVQKHDATRLHYDFRLELDGVLKSWAVTKGPSLSPRERRLAVRTEDHPLDYGGFEGTIPKGEYGGGTVMLWDRGTWEPVGDPHEGLAEGKLKFHLDGERLRGGWMLVRMPPRPKETRENWLLIKERDETADDADPILADNMVSVTTGRSMQEIAGGNSAVWHSNKAARGSDAPKRASRAAVKGLALPEFRPPQLATLVDVPPEGPDWVHELKYDGYRCLVAANGAEVRCYTRSGQDWTAKFPMIAEAIRSMAMPGVLVDGEIVAFDANGRTDFSTLQKTLSEGGPIAFFAFDLLEQAGEDLTELPLLERKDRLQALFDDLPKGSAIHVSTHIRGQGEAVLEQVCKSGHEGIVAKRASAPYRGTRAKTWLKVKCTRRQEFVIGGWTPSEKRHGFKSLLVGAWEDGKLRYAGRVGTGFDDRDLEALSARFETLDRKTSPFDSVPRDVKRRARWVEPQLVAEIAYTEFTADGVLRHPSFLGLREDKSASDVQIEKPAPPVDAPAAPAPPPAPAAPAAPAKPGDEGPDVVRSGVRVTSPGKILFPAQGLTKGDLVSYYEAMAELMLPHLGNRPLSLVRCPQGRSRKCFFQKHDSGGFPAELKRVMIAESSGAEEQYFYINDVKGIVAGVQMGVLEFHIWGSRVDQVEKPDRLVFDLDPDEGLGFEDVRRAAFDLRDRLAAMRLTTFPMLSGGKGFHVVAPLTRRAAWPEVKAFCRGFAVQLGEEAPDRYIANMSKARRKGRIFVDYLRNDRGSTAIAPYSTRSRDGAPVSAPITWEEAASVSGANVFTVQTMPERARRIGDPWPGYFQVKQTLTKSMLRAVGAE
jgi:bifunctional non-homologous end joining protein LigD